MDKQITPNSHQAFLIVRTMNQIAGGIVTTFKKKVVARTSLQHNYFILDKVM